MIKLLLHSCGVTPVVMQFAGEHISVVWPSSIKTQEPVLPLPPSSIYAMR